MKLHLPVRLFRAIITLMVTAPLALNAAYTLPTEIIIPDGYTVVETDALSDITAYSSSSADVAFKLSQNLEINGLSSALMTNNGSSWYFTSAEVNSLSTLIFSNATTLLFNVADGEKLDFAYLKSLTFSGNSANSTDAFAGGGAIRASVSTVTLRGNGSVTFSGNTASSGGAIYAGYNGTVTLSGNGDVTFSGNSASGQGGAISAGTVTLSGNGDVTFSGNTADYVGAIDANEVTLSGNGNVTFSGNRTSYFGGAIYNEHGTVTLSGNGDVLFEKNAKGENDTYILRSIETKYLNLSASEGKKIEFRDSIYASGRVKLNEGGAGNIIFTGATTEADLLSIKGSAGTDDEISASRLSMLRVVELFGGSLMVQHQATLQSEVFMVKQAADATLVLENGHVDARHFIVNSGNTLSLKGENTLSAGYGKIDGTMQFAVESAHATNAMVSYSGFLDLSEATFDIQSAQTTASYQLLSLQKRSVVKWNDDLVFTASGIDSSRLVWKDGVLYWDISGNVTESKQVLGDYIFSTDWTLQHVTDKNQITGTGNLAFCLDTDVEWDGLASSLINNSSSHVFITGEQSADGKPLYSFDFDNATSRAFKVTSLMVADLKEVTFSGNSASSGGAIDAGYNGTVTLSGNGAVTFIGNWASDDGGAINADEVTLSDNGAVTFSGNTANSTDSYAGGGAIYADTVTLSDNGAVTFSGNTASGSSSAHGGAIYASDNGAVTLSDNGAVTFSGNTASSYGGAIYASGGTVILSGNSAVTFSGNTASGGYVYGGAIDAGYTGAVTLSDNGAVTFSGNNVTATGGKYSRACGGAISAETRTVTLSGNSSVTFSGNMAIAAGEYSDAEGGAIYAGSVTLSGNGDVTFSGNRASVSGSTSAWGGAIYAYEGIVTLSGNGDVLFEKNAEVENGTYRLRSIYTEKLNLSASGGKKIEFRDSIYASGTVNLNADYMDAKGVVHKQTGDIIFTGATTEADLLAVKKAHLLDEDENADVSNLSVAESEITNSRTSIVETETHLYGGRLRIEDGAVYQGAGLTVHENSAATVLLKDATMTHENQAVSFARGTTLASAGVSQLTADSLTMADGSAWSFDVSSANATSAVLTYSGSLMLSGELSVNLTINGALINGASYQLLTGAAKPTNWTADNITVTTATSGWSVDFADLTWVDNTLWLYYDTRPDLTIATWSNESNDGLWNTSSENWVQGEHDYAYQDGVQVVFGDVGVGTVKLVGAQSPTSVLVSSTQNYSFEGDGKLTGGMNLTKQGEGTLIINTANDYIGGTLINGGKLVAGTATALGSGEVSLNNGELDLGGLAVSNAITADGGSLTNASAYAGELTVNGALTVGANTTAGSLVFNSGGYITGDSFVVKNKNNYTIRGSEITFDSLTGGVVFSGNTASGSSANGGAIYNASGSSYVLSGNGVVMLNGNRSFAEGSDACGGAIYNRGSVEIRENEDVLFSLNSVQSSKDALGGAICYHVTMRENKNLSFHENTAYSSAGNASGGAYFDYDAIISENQKVEFTNNKAIGLLGASGGAISAGSYGWVSLSRNGDVFFRGNIAESTNGIARGGAIYADSADWWVTLIDNKDISFSGNIVKGGEGTYGGAIYAASITIQGNDNVLFEKNTEISKNEYRLRSLYSTGLIRLSASAGKKIEFRDSIYASGTVNLNVDGAGDIIFTGATTEADLLAVKGSAGTADEITDSRTSVVEGTTNLHGGRLRVEDGAVYQGYGITVEDGANATILLKDGTLDHTGYDITIGASDTLSLTGENILNAATLSMENGSTIQVAPDVVNIDGDAALTTTGTWDIGSITLDLPGSEYLTVGDYKLFTRTEGESYDISGWTLNGATTDQLKWIDGTLYYKGGYDWNHGVTENQGIEHLEEILGNLIINGGDITLDDVVQAIEDEVAAGFGKGEGHIVINRGGIHISGAGDLDGHIIFNGDLKDIRKLFIEKDITNIKIELGGNAAADNIVDVGEKSTIEIDELTGEGSMDKTGKGHMKVHGTGHQVGGKLDVQEGDFSMEADSEAHVHELAVGNKEDKEAKVHVKKGAKVTGDSMLVDGTHAKVTNEGSMAFTDEVKVKGGHLDNHGHMSKVHLEGGKVSGSGHFAGLEMRGGELVVGNSPGIQSYTGAADLQSGKVVFSVAGDVAASEGAVGWDSGTHSVMDMNGNALTLGSDVVIEIALGGELLEYVLAATDEAPFLVDVDLVLEVGNTVYYTESVLSALASQTTFIVTDEVEGISNMVTLEAGSSLADMVKSYSYSLSGNTLSLSVTMAGNGEGLSAVPEPTTATLSLLALTGLMLRRRRK